MASIGDNKESDPSSKRRNTKKMPPLHELAQKRELHHLIPAALSGSDINARYDFKKTLLHLALENDCSVDTLNVLKEAGADIGARDQNGNNALVFALKGDCSDVVINELLEYDWGIFFQERCVQRETLLYLAARKKRLYVFIPAIVKYKKIDYRDSYTRYMTLLLHYALRYDCPRSVEMILQYMSPSSLNETDGNGNTYLHYAVLEDYGSEKIRVLLNAGLNPATKNKFGDTALHLAIRRACPRSVETILQFMSPSSLNETDGDGDTYLHCAVREGCRSRIICALLKAGVNPATKNNMGDSALYFLINFPREDFSTYKWKRILKEFLRGHPEIVEDRDSNDNLSLMDNVDNFFRSIICIILKWVLLQNGADFQWNRVSDNPNPYETVLSFFRDCRSELELLRAFMVTDTMSLGDLVKACYVSPKFVNELRVKSRFVRVLQFEGILAVYEEEVRDIVRMVRVCSSLYGKTLPFPVLKNGSYVNVSRKVLDYLSVDDLEKLALALNLA